MVKTKTLTIQLNGEQLPIFPSEQDSHFTLATHAGGDKPGKTGNRAVLLLLSKAALNMTETICENGFRIHLDELYDINAEGKNILILREE